MEIPPPEQTEKNQNQNEKQDGVDIVYVVGDGSCCENFELKCSLRSIAQFATDVRRIFVVGNPPDFLSNKVITAKIPDLPNRRKHYNILHCLNETVKQFNLTEPFLYSSDDHFLCRPTSFRNYPVYCRFTANKQGLVYNEEERFRIYGKNYPNPSKYQQCLIQTKECLEKNGLVPLWTNWHGNTWMFPEVMQEAEDFVNAHSNEVNSLGFEPTILITALHAKRIIDKGEDFNMVAARPIDPKTGNFEKLKRWAYSEGRFSCTDTIWLNKEFIAFMQGMFFLPCKYEKEYSTGG